MIMEIIHAVRVLVVDDDPTIRETIGLALHAEGYEAIFAKDGREGIELVQAEEPDLLILDIRLPKMSGLKVLEKVRNDYSDTVPVIMITGEYNEKTMWFAESHGIDGFFKKPFDIKELLDSVNQILN